MVLQFYHARLGQQEVIGTAIVVAVECLLPPSVHIILITIPYSAHELSYNAF